MKKYFIAILFIGCTTTPITPTSNELLDNCKKYAEIMKEQGMAIYRLKLIEYLDKNKTVSNSIIKEIDSAYSRVKDLSAKEIIAQ